MSIAGRVLFVTACSTCIGASAADEPKHGEFAAETVKVGNVTREFRLVVPKTVELTKPGLRDLDGDHRVQCLGVKRDRPDRAGVDAGHLELAAGDQVVGVVQLDPVGPPTGSAR